MSVPPSEPHPRWGTVLRGFVDARLITMFVLGLAVGVPGTAGWWSVYGVLAADEFGKRRLAEIVPPLAFGSLALWMVAAVLTAPLVDLVRPPFAHRLGRRRGWLVTLIAAAMAVVIGLMVLAELRASPVAGPVRIAAGAVALLVCGVLASAVDGYRLERMPMRAQGLALMAQLFGAACAAAILFGVTAKAVPPLAAVLTALVLLGLGLFATLRAGAPDLAPGQMADSRASDPLGDAKPASEPRASCFAPFSALIAAHRYWLPLGILATLGTAGIALAQLVDIGLGESGDGDVRPVTTTTVMLGASAAVLGVVLGAAGVARYGAVRAMFPFAAASMLVIVAVETVSRSGGGDTIFAAIRAVAIGIASGGYIAALALLARFTARRFAASQWAAFMACASVLSLSGDGIRAAMAAIGRLPFNLMALATCLLALLILPHLARHLDATERDTPR